MNPSISTYNAVLKRQAMQIQYCTPKEETTIAVTTSETVTAVGAITELIISIMDITNIIAITKITVITETIITPVYKRKLMKYAFQETFVFR